jgi:hypothetical protein
VGSKQTVFLHGYEWDMSEIEDIVWQCQQSNWTKEEWKLSPALVSKDGRGTRPYYEGEDYDPTIWDLIPDGYDHDHCVICLWTLTVSQDPEISIGWVNKDGAWLCNECYEKLIMPTQ